ncbi:MAG TPA: twin-arginine translocation signal domain-containing protein, partial [Opitutus sp.]|nr:twin-arginine translocation signal domain-containing protein [Opitutus sp.]
MPTRRQFLKSSVVAGAAVSLGDFALRPLFAAVGAPDPASAPSWVDKPMRWAQLAFVDDDPVKIDAGFWFDYFKRIHADGVCLSAGGCTAFYPTEIPFHHRSPFLGQRDLFGEFVAGCRKLGMVVVARTDPHATYDDAKAAHPDWIAVGEDGQPRRHWASPDMWVTCGLGPYNFDFMSAVNGLLERRVTAREIVAGGGLEVGAAVFAVAHAAAFPAVDEDGVDVVA